jgi:hypothetical protein
VHCTAPKGATGLHRTAKRGYGHIISGTEFLDRLTQTAHTPTAQCGNLLLKDKIPFQREFYFGGYYRTVPGKIAIISKKMQQN